MIPITINSIVQRREAVTAINNFDVTNGIRKSQKAKYEMPTWYYLACVLNGSNGRYLSLVEIEKILADHHIEISQQSLRKFLIMMGDTEHHIHPHRRNCGIECHEIVSHMGRVYAERAEDFGWNPEVYAGAPPMLYWFGQPDETVKYWKKAFNLRLVP